MTGPSRVGDVDRGAERRLGERDRHLEREVAPLAAEERVARHVDHDVEVAGRRALLAGLRPCPSPGCAGRPRPRGDADLHRAARGLTPVPWQVGHGVSIRRAAALAHRADRGQREQALGRRRARRARGSARTRRAWCPAPHPCPCTCGRARRSAGSPTWSRPRTASSKSGAAPSRRPRRAAAARRRRDAEEPAQRGRRGRRGRHRKVVPPGARKPPNPPNAPAIGPSRRTSSYSLRLSGSPSTS